MLTLMICKMNKDDHLKKYLWRVLKSMDRIYGLVTVCHYTISYPIKIIALLP